MPDRFPAFGKADLSNCDREPIRVPGSIQPHGVLLAFSPGNLLIRRAAGATLRLLGQEPAALLGQHAGALHPVLAGAVAELAASVEDRSAASRRITLAGIPCDTVAHRAGAELLIEIEPLLEPDLEAPLATAEAMLLRARHVEGVAIFCQAMAEEIRGLTGFDRVMVYRFHADGSGEVVAEARAVAAEAFLGLRYPASDIPRQARELYLRNWVRIIPDIAYTPAPILAGEGVADPLDLTFSVLRSVSPIHLAYLRNMGVAASMSLSVVVGGQLWGLVACHHETPRYLPYRVRMACEIFALVASAQLESNLGALALAAQRHATQVRMGLVALMSREADLAAGLMRFQPNLLDYIAADGVGIWSEGRFTAIGATPGPTSVAKLVGWLDEHAEDDVFHTDQLALVCPALREDAAIASGLIALPVSRRRGDYVLWFRRELPRVVTWAGNPNKPAEMAPDGLRLSPRRSFAAWRESVRLQAAPWEVHEIEAARALRVFLMEVVLQRIEAVAREREAARSAQERLSAELDRRVAELRALADALQSEARRRAEAEAELSQALRRTVELQEEERRQIARELHDSAGQTLTLLQLGLDRVARATVGDPAVAAEVGGLKELAGDLGSELSRLAREIRPTALDDLGLEAALLQLVEVVTRATGLRCEAALSLDGGRPTPEVETALYRVTQEALTNVVRHAGAQRAWVRLHLEGGRVCLAVEDDGCGFDPAALPGRRPPGAHLGLVGMRERVAQVGGSIAIGPRPGGGTRLTVVVGT